MPVPFPTFAAFHGAVARRLLARARRLNAKDPEDTVQDVWTILLQVEPSKWTAAYAMEVLKNEVVHEFRRPRLPQVPLETEPGVAGEPATTQFLGSPIDAREQLDRVHTLDTPENVALLMARAQGAGSKELAAELKITAGALYSRVNDIRRRLRPIARALETGVGNGHYGLGIDARRVDCTGQKLPLRASCVPLVLDRQGVLRGSIRLGMPTAMFAFGTVHLIDRQGRQAVSSLTFPVATGTEPDVLNLHALFAGLGREVQWPNEQVVMCLYEPQTEQRPG